MKVTAVTPGDVARLHSAMRATPRHANLTIAVLSKAMSLAERWGLRPRGTNPCLGLERYRENARDRVLTDAELQRLGEVLREAEGREHPTMMAAVLLLLLTGRRVSELCGLRWTDVDLDGGAVRLRDTKAGGVQRHALGAGAVRVLSTLERGPGVPWVLPAPTDPAKPLSRHSVSQVWQRLRTAAGVAAVRLHDLRHGFATLAAAGGANAFTLRDALGHRTLSITQGYVARTVEPMRALVETVGARVLEGLAFHVGGPVIVPTAARFDPIGDVLTIRLGDADEATLVAGGSGIQAARGAVTVGEPMAVRPLVDAAAALVGVEIIGASALMPALRPARQRATAALGTSPAASPGATGRITKRTAASRPAKRVLSPRKPSGSPSH